MVISGLLHVRVKAMHRGHQWREKNVKDRGLPWWPRGSDSVLPVQRASFHPWSGD